ncbi:MAG: hypothetical protein GX639_09245 [Fibrobacter sp.]|nr:hypothetical protein [Fibrobacter sp.]
MAFSNKLDKESFDKLLEIIDRNRWDRLRKRQEQLDNVEEEELESDDTELSPDTVKVVLFGTECPFIHSMIEMLRNETVIAFLSDPEKMITFCMDHQIPNLILDIDPPSDYNLVMDAFASAKILLPDTRIFACSSRKSSIEVEHMKMHGAVILDKPILRKQVKKFCSQYCR